VGRVDAIALDHYDFFVRIQRRWFIDRELEIHAGLAVEIHVLRMLRQVVRASCEIFLHLDGVERRTTRPEMQVVAHRNPFRV